MVLESNEAVLTKPAFPLSSEVAASVYHVHTSTTILR